MVLSNTRREAAEAAADELRQEASFKGGGRGLVGLATASVAISALAVRDPPPGIDRNAYFLALTGAFFAGVAEVIVAVSVSSSTNNPGVHRAAGRKLMYYASVAPLAVAVAVALSAASLLW
ncbi:unnamed protein product [Urochloa decumbens]|uniref:Uncharacterized protein n=1 Tax=Urochloa decumbens TaxID=240449 RepID=A0ABC8Z0K8_9POAL